MATRKPSFSSPAVLLTGLLALLFFVSGWVLTQNCVVEGYCADSKMPANQIVFAMSFLLATASFVLWMSKNDR